MSRSQGISALSPSSFSDLGSLLKGTSYNVLRAWFLIIIRISHDYRGLVLNTIYKCGVQFVVHLETGRDCLIKKKDGDPMGTGK